MDAQTEREIKEWTYSGNAKLSKKEVLVLKGLITGDGDIGGRMASSHPGAKPPVDDGKMEILRKLAELHRKWETPLNEIDTMHGKEWEH